MKDLTQEEKGWIAGMIDADGSIIMRERSERKGYKASIKIANNDTGVINKLEELIPQSNTYSQTEDNYNSEEWYQFVIAKSEVMLKLLDQIKDYLQSIKREKANILVKYLKCRERKEVKRNSDGTFASKSSFGDEEEKLYQEFVSLG